MVWYIDKEFGFSVDDQYPLMKFLMLYDEKNIKKYNDIMEREMKKSDKRSSMTTFR